MSPTTVLLFSGDKRPLEVSSNHNDMKGRLHNLGKGILLALACMCSLVDPLQALPTEAKFLFEFGSEGSENGLFDDPQGIAVNEFGEIIVADTHNDRVQVFDRCGNFLFAFGETGSGPGQFLSPNGVAITKDNCIAVADRDIPNVQVFDRWGTFLYRFGTFGTGQGELNTSDRVAVNEWGEFIVNSFSVKVVQVFDRYGNFLVKIDDLPDFPSALDVDSDGNIYIGISGEVDAIRVYDRWGRFLFQFGTSGTETGNLFNIKGLAVSESGKIVTVELRDPSPIQVFDNCGDFLFDFFVDTGVLNLSDVAISEDGNIYILDRTNHRVLVYQG